MLQHSRTRSTTKTYHRCHLSPACSIHNKRSLNSVGANILIWPPLQPRRSGHILANQGRDRTPHKSRKYTQILGNLAEHSTHQRTLPVFLPCIHVFFPFVVADDAHLPATRLVFFPECAVFFPPLHVEPEKFPGSFLACGRNGLAISIPLASALRGG